MEYLALYRKYRPLSFDDMVGQNEIKAILKSSVINNTISHAYLFSGPRGTGKTSTAKIFAKMVNCENLVDGIPCGHCSSCLSFANNSDIIEIDAASNNGVDEIRDLREKVNLIPSSCKYKVYIIDEVHMLTTQAFNALLKTLEEPPKHVIFILATTEYHKVPLTITSRCQKFQFNKVNIEDNYNKLKEIAIKEKISISDEALLEIAKLSDGGMRDSINFLDQLRSFKQDNIDIDDVFEVCGNVSNEEICNLLINLKKYNLVEISDYLENIGNKGKSYTKFLEDVLYFLKECILFKNDISYKNLKLNVDCLKNICDIYSLNDIYMVINQIDKLMEKLKYSSRQSILLVTSFLSISNTFCGSEYKNKEDINNDIFKINYNNINSDEHVNQVDENLQLNKESVNNEIYDYSNSFCFINRDLIINNAFATASKDIKNVLQDKWKKIDDFLLDSKYKVIASLLRDCKISVVGDDYIVFNTLYDSVVKNLYMKNDMLDDFISLILGKKYYFAFITDELWNKYKNDYVNYIKNGNKYVLKDLLLSNRDDENDLPESNSIVDRLINIVGDDIVEFK